MTIPTQRRPYADLGDWTLVAYAQSGDRAAFAALWTRYYPGIVAYASRRLGRHELAEEIAGDVFAAAWANISHVSDQGKPYVAWLRTIARNRCIDHISSHRYRREILDDTACLEVADHADVQWDVERASTARQVRDLVAARLTDKQRKAIELTVFEGLESHEAGRLMGMSRQAVTQLCMRARETLRPLLIEMGLQ